ncbi:hypothetical protein [Burkholderia sp. Ac-20365]|uniref:hypothetical protein n=1 Tax=Burkholderia sp. Ac-20365 TaxID=2703897 RepID=UPI00197C38B9|nr:hypothetical protein [Burkholderia sp. Ac-20365]
MKSQHTANAATSLAKSDTDLLPQILAATGVAAALERTGEPIDLGSGKVLHRFDECDGKTIEPDRLHIVTDGAGGYTAIIDPDTSGAREFTGHLADLPPAPVVDGTSGKATDQPAATSGRKPASERLHAVIRFKRTVDFPRFSMEEGQTWSFAVYGALEQRLAAIKAGERFDFAGGQCLAQDVELIYEGPGNREFARFRNGGGMSVVPEPLQGGEPVEPRQPGIKLVLSGRFITDAEHRKVAEMYQPGESVLEGEMLKRRIVGSFNALPDLVGILLRADKEGALWQALYNEGITDSYDVALANAVKALGDAGVIDVAHRYELDIEAVRAKVQST